jgi:hypothetical protein
MMKILKLPKTEPLRKPNVYEFFGFDPASPEATPRQVGFVWVCIGFVLALFSQIAQFDIFS